MSKSQKNLAKSVEKLRESARMSKAEVARAAEMSPQQFAATMDGRDIRLSVLDRIAGALKVSSAELIESEEERRARETRIKALGEEISSLQSTRPPEAISSQERLRAAAQLLNDDEAAILLELAQNFLQKRTQNLAAEKNKKAQ